MKSNVLKLAYVVLGSLVAICVYLAMIPFYIDYASGDGTELIDPRIYARENKIKRGNILDRHGLELASSVPIENGYARQYPLGSAVSHIIGYYSSTYGSAGLEKSMARVLLGLEDNNKLFNLYNRILGRSSTGSDITLTIDAGLQKNIFSLLANKRGAVVVLEPATGEVLALVSYPNYDPMKVADYIDYPDAPLLNRATQGAYPPGSIFKIITASAVLSDMPSLAGDTINCTGQLKVNGFTLHDNAVHGQVEITKAFAESCNVAFGSYGMSLGADKLTQQAKAFGIGRKYDFPLPVYVGNITPASKMDGPLIASSAIGQGEVLVSPFQAALMACTVANRGLIMKPYIIGSIKDPHGGVREQQSVEWLQSMEPSVAEDLKEEMIYAVKQGTGRAAALPGVTVAGKTGSAENPHGKSHAWFVGFAPAEQPRVVVAVLLENAGSGGSVAAPLAREVIRRSLE